MKLKKLITCLVFIVLIIGCNHYIAGPIMFPKQPHGYDISHHNKNIKWDKLNAQFVYLKATEGTTFKDPKFIEYTRQAKAHGIKVGAYHFMSPTTSGKKQFEYFSKKVGNSMDLIPVLDVEVMGIADDDIKQFIDACEKHYGVKPMIYANLFFYGKHYSVIKDCTYGNFAITKTSTTDYVNINNCQAAAFGANNRLFHFLLYFSSRHNYLQFRRIILTAKNKEYFCCNIMAPKQLLLFTGSIQ